MEGGRARFLIAAVGILSAHHLPDIPGLDDFKGGWHHTVRWPHRDPDLAGKRVGVIGTGATAVQLITEIAPVVGRLSVFQRTPNYCAPLRNGPIDAETQRKIKAGYPEIFRRIRKTTAAFIHDFDPRSVFEVLEEERMARFEELWAQPGFAKWLGNFRDIMTNPEANEIYAEFVRNKIRERVRDPAVAEKLVRKDGSSVRRQAHPARERILRGLQSRQRDANRSARISDRADHRGRDKDAGCGLSAGRDHLRYRVRCGNRAAHATRYPRREGRFVQGEVGGRAANLSRRADSRLSKLVHPECGIVLQHAAMHRDAGRLDRRLYRVHARAGLCRGDRGGRGWMDDACGGEGESIVT